MRGAPQLTQVHVQTLYEAAAKQPPSRSEARPLVMTVESAPPLLDKELN
jgi:hypothetical protein